MTMYFNKMMENRHYFVYFFTKVEHALSIKFIASYHTIIQLWPQSLTKLTTSNAPKIFTDVHLLVSIGHY